MQPDLAESIAITIIVVASLIAIVRLTTPTDDGGSA